MYINVGPERIKELSLDDASDALMGAGVAADQIEKLHRDGKGFIVKFHDDEMIGRFVGKRIELFRE